MNQVKPEHYVRLSEAVQAVKAGARAFPEGTQNLALKAAGQVLLDGVVGTEYRVWDDDEDPEVTIQALTAELIGVISHLRGIDPVAARDAVRSTLLALAPELEHRPVPMSTDAPF